MLKKLSLSLIVLFVFLVSTFSAFIFLGKKSSSLVSLKTNFSSSSNSNEALENFMVTSEPIKSDIADSSFLNNPKGITKRKIIILKDFLDEKLLSSVIAPNEKIISYIKPLKSIIVEYSEEQESISNSFLKPVSANSDNLILAVEPDFVVTALESEYTDPLYSEQWAFNAYSETSSPISDLNPNTTIAVVDSGVCFNHPDLKDVFIQGFDFIDNDLDPSDEFNHGCGVAGLISANSNNGIGIRGLSSNSKILPVRVLNNSGVGSYSTLAMGIVYAVESGADIINLSLGGYFDSEILKLAVDYAVNKGVKVYASAGNTSNETVLYPALYENVISVGSISYSNSKYSKSTFSSTGKKIDIWAPGDGVLTTSSDGSYKLVSGTSFANSYAIFGGINLIPISAEEKKQYKDLTYFNGAESRLYSVDTYIATTPVDYGEPVKDFKSVNIRYGINVSSGVDIKNVKIYGTKNGLPTDIFNTEIELIKYKEIIGRDIQLNREPSSDLDIYNIFATFEYKGEEKKEKTSFYVDWKRFDYGDTVKPEVVVSGDEIINDPIFDEALDRAYKLDYFKGNVDRVFYLINKQETQDSKFVLLIPKSTYEQDNHGSQHYIAFVVYKGELRVANDNNSNIDISNWPEELKHLLRYDVTFQSFKYGNEYIFMDGTPTLGSYSDVFAFAPYNCTSYVSFMMNKMSGTLEPPYAFQNIKNGYKSLGNANTWDDGLLERGFVVNNNPKVNSIAVWESFSKGAGENGHVALVEEVNPDSTVNISEYNWYPNYLGYNERYNVKADKYVHFIASDLTLTPPTITLPTDGAVIDSFNFNLSLDNEKGSYKKFEVEMSSPNNTEKTYFYVN